MTSGTVNAAFLALQAAAELIDAKNAEIDRLREREATLLTLLTEAKPYIGSAAADINKATLDFHDRIDAALDGGEEA